MPTAMRGRARCATAARASFCSLPRACAPDERQLDAATRRASRAGVRACCSARISVGAMRAACQPELDRQHARRRRRPPSCRCPRRPGAAGSWARAAPCRAAISPKHPLLRAGEREREARHAPPARRRGRGVEGDARPPPCTPRRRRASASWRKKSSSKTSRRKGGVARAAAAGEVGAGRREVGLRAAPRRAPSRPRRARTAAGRSSTAQRRQLVAEPLHELAERRVLVVGRARVDRDDAAEVGRVALAGASPPPGGSSAGARRSPRSPCPSTSSVLARRELLLPPGRRVEEDQVEPARAVGRARP